MAREDESPLSLITGSKLWFMEQSRRLTLIIVMLSILSGLSITLNIIQFLAMPTPVYFAQTPDLRLTEMTPLNEPYLTQEGVSDWTLAVVDKTLSLGFNDYKQKLTEVQPNFFEAAFADFVRSMKAAGTFDMVEGKRLVMNAAPLASPVIAAKGLNEQGVMSWRIEFPMMISYESSQGVFLTQNIDVTALVERVSVLDNPKGIRIRQLLLKPKK